jgi:hypothetical protein
MSCGLGLVVPTWKNCSGYEPGSEAVRREIPDRGRRTARRQRRAFGKNPVLPNQQKKNLRRPLGLQEHHATSQIPSHSLDMSNPTAASPLALSVSNLNVP